tara:strand:+ start:531 stop:1322 length:792 start_codon:yes stop_codon:yes gene_type:complete
LLFEIPFLFIAGFVGGMLNTFAGGGSFITFPALLFAGVPPISANATNTFASCSGYLSGAYAFRKELRVHSNALPRIILLSLIGGLIGAWLLLNTPESLFHAAIPWLLLLATGLFIYGGHINSRLSSLASLHRYMPSIGQLLLLLLLLIICIYGGFFNAGLGIIVLSYLTLAGYRDINAMNGIKLLISSVVSLIAIAVFIYNDVIAWYQGMIVLLGTLTGGYIAAHISRHVSQYYIRNIVIVTSIIITTYFFYDVYVDTLITAA